MTTRLERFATFVARIGSFRAMKKQVVSQALRGLESFATNFAPDRRIGGVCRQMSFIQQFAVEVSFASITRVIYLDNPLSRRISGHEMSGSHVVT